METERRPEIYSELIKYYDQVHAGAGFWETTEALWDLIEQSPVDIPLTYEQLLESEAVPAMVVFEHNSGLARDVQAILPFAVVGPSLDRSSYDVCKVGEWYDMAVRETQRVAAERHNPACLNHSDLSDCRCQNSQFCPLRYLEMTLGDEALKRNFDDESYRRDPMRADMLTAIKLSVGLTTGILTESLCEDRLREYRFRIDAHGMDA